MTGADIGVGWVDQNGTVYFQVWNSFSCKLIKILWLFILRIDMQ